MAPYLDPEVSFWILVNLKSDLNQVSGVFPVMRVVFGE